MPSRPNRSSNRSRVSKLKLNLGKPMNFNQSPAGRNPGIHSVRNTHNGAPSAAFIKSLRETRNTRLQSGYNRPAWNYK